MTVGSTPPPALRLLVSVWQLCKCWRFGIRFSCLHSKCSSPLSYPPSREGVGKGSFYVGESWQELSQLGDQIQHLTGVSHIRVWENTMARWSLRRQSNATWHAQWTQEYEKNISDWAWWYMPVPQAEAGRSQVQRRRERFKASQGSWATPCLLKSKRAGNVAQL